MDNRTTLRSQPTGAYFMLLLALWGIIVAAGMKFSGNSEILDGLRYYGRYDGLSTAADPGGIYSHFTAAAHAVLPCLLQITALFLFSQSPLLIPVCLSLIGYRGVILGAVLSLPFGPSDVPQIMLYAAVTAVICIVSAMFIARCGRCSQMSNTLLFLTASGACVVGEVILSYI